MSERNVLKLDINSLTEFQKELHYSKDPKNEKDTVKLRFSCNIDKYAWSTHTKSKMSHIADEGEVIYTASKKFDVLFKTSIHINLPPIKVKDKYKKTYRICYPHNPGHNICNQGELKIDDDHREMIDSVWMDIHSQYYCKNGAGMREHYDRMVGNLPCLLEWGTELPGVPLVVPQPYSYSRNTRVGLLILQSPNNTITHHYKMKTKITDFLNMQVKIKNPDKTYYWQDIPCKMQYLETPGDIKEIPIPEMWGRYALMTDSERKWQKSIDPETGEQAKDPMIHVSYIEDIIMTTSNNPTPLGSTAVIPLHSKTPCKAIFWVAQNIKNIENRNLSNYTTNSEDLYRGWNPCSVVDLKYGGANRLDKVSHEHFELSEPWDFFPSAPAEPGYNVYPFCFEPSTLNADTAIVLDPLNVSLQIKLGDTDPFKSIDDDDEEEEYDEDGEIIPPEVKVINDNTKERYLIHVRAIVYKKVETVWDDKAKKLKYTVKEDYTNQDLMYQ